MRLCWEAVTEWFEGNLQKIDLGVSRENVIQGLIVLARTLYADALCEVWEATGDEHICIYDAVQCLDERKFWGLEDEVERYIQSCYEPPSWI